jgi:prepilin-type N-terminal cleavage/methylation domain-containing protein
MKVYKFTIIELLVVVAIIGILLSIMLPSLMKARDAAMSASCLSNQKQLYIGFMRYAQKNDQKVPFNEYANGNAKCPSWEPQISQYLGVEYPEEYFGTKTLAEFKAANGNKYKNGKAKATVDNPLLRCPADRVQTQATSGFARSYQANAFQNYWKNKYTNNHAYSKYGIIRTKDQRFIFQFDLNPILLSEDTFEGYEGNKQQGNSWNAVIASIGDFDKVTTPHYSMKFNLLFLDGSATSKKKNEMRMNNYELFQSFADD